MSKTSIIQLMSNDPENYGEISFKPIIPWNCKKIKYKVIGINTYANFLITTNDDYLEVELSDEAHCVNFTNKYNYDVDSLADDLTELLTSLQISVELDNSGVLKFTGHSDFKILSASHRVQLLLGIYNTSFPIVSDNQIVYANSSPLTSFGNVLYLESIQGNPVSTTLGTTPYTGSVLARFNTFLKYDVPVILCEEQLRQNYVIVNVEAIRSIKINLTDFMFEKILLKSPLFITLKMKPIFDSD